VRQIPGSGRSNSHDLTQGEMSQSGSGSSDIHIRVSQRTARRCGCFGSGVAAVDRYSDPTMQ
jgi:hypothetical protein